MASKRGWLTPNSGATEYICRPVYIPVDDTLAFIAAVNGALNELTNAYNWEAFGDMTPDEAAAEMLLLYTQYVTDPCGINGPCLIPPNIYIGITFPTRVIRRGPGGYTEELIGNEWQEPTGDYEVPDVPVRTDPTSEERRCLAAINAATVLEQMYEDATDAYAEFGTLQSVVDAILGVITVAMGLFGQVTAAAYMSLGQNALDTFFEITGIIAEDYWQTPFTAELACIFFDHAIDTAGVVTFDFDGINTTLMELQADNLGDVDKALLISQVGYFLSIMAAGGLNIAGSTTSVTDYDCACLDEWCWEIDFDIDNGGFVVTNGSQGLDNLPYGSYGSGRWNGVYNAPNLGGVGAYIYRAIPANTEIHRIEIDVYTTSTGDRQTGWRTSNDGVQNGNKSSGTIPPGDYTYSWEGAANNLPRVADYLEVWVYAQTISGVSRIEKVRLYGIGTPPSGYVPC